MKKWIVILLLVAMFVWIISTGLTMFAEAREKSLIETTKKQLLGWENVYNHLGFMTCDTLKELDKEWNTNQEVLFKDVVWEEAKLTSAFKKAWIIKWFEDETFKPDLNITRAEFLSIVLKTYCLTEKEWVEIKDFKDVKKDHWHYEVVRNTYSHGMTKGYNDWTFKPNNNISWFEAIVMLNRLIDLKIAYVENDFIDKIKSNDDYVKQTLGYTLAILKLDPEEAWIEPNKAITRQEFVELLFIYTQKFSKPFDSRL